MTQSRRLERRRAMESLTQGRLLLKQSSEAHDQALDELSRRREALSDSVFGGRRPQEVETQVEEDLKTLRQLKSAGQSKQPILHLIPQPFRVL